MKCTICQREIPAEGPNGSWKLGHNAEPVTDGRCCKECNDYIVIPVRLAPRMGAKQAVDAAIAIEEATKKMKEHYENGRPTAH